MKNQVGAIPFRRTISGSIEVLLITTRGTKRWVVPKGWPWRRRPNHQAAAGEAWEEGGVRGEAGPNSIGSFEYDKRVRGTRITLTVVVYLLEVTEESADWPEIEQRQRSWFSPGAAADLVSEPGLKAILLSFVDATAWQAAATRSNMA